MSDVVPPLSNDSATSSVKRGWLDQRIDVVGIRRTLLDREVPDRLTWWHTLGSAAMTAFLIQVVTGLVLATFYAPTPDHAYESIQYVQREVNAGVLLRAMHRWGASLMVVFVLAHMIRVFSMGAYKYPREANWLFGVGLFFLVLGFGFTGSLLPWDQKAYWATQVGTSIAGTTPWIGGAMAKMLKGGSQLGAATLTRFYAFHVLWLPVLFAALLLLHLMLVVRQGIAPRTDVLEDKAPKRTSDPVYPAYYGTAYAASKHTGVRFWPDIIAKDVITSLVVALAVLILAVTVGAPLEPPADPSDSSYIPHPEWYFLPFYQLLKLFPGSMESTIAVGVPLLLVIALLGLPFFDRGSRRNLLHRPGSLAALSVLLGGSALLVGAAVRDVQPTIAPETGRQLSSAERAGRALFQRQCLGCHVVMNKGGDEGPALMQIGAHHTTAWLHSFIEEPRRFHPNSRMAAFGSPVLSHQEIEEVSRYLATLRGSPGAEITPQIHDTFPDLQKSDGAAGATKNEKSASTNARKQPTQ